jgi:hypothetical protein
MKTTVEVSDELFERAKRVSKDQKTTFRELVEQGLRLALDERETAETYRWPGRVFGASQDAGLTPDVEAGGWERVMELAYEERGG